MRIKDTVNLRNDKTQRTNLPYIALENITSWDASFEETEASTEGTNNLFYSGDILFGKLRPYLAKGYIPNYNGICSTEFLVMEAKDGYFNRYLLYYFLSHSLIDYIRNQVAGVKMPRTNWNSFSTIEINVPPHDEQHKIVTYLDTKTAAINKRIAVLEKKQEVYSRLRRSIINRAVTRGLNPDFPLKDSGVDWIGMIPGHWGINAIKRLGFLIGGNGFKEEYQGDYFNDVKFIKVNALSSNISMTREYDTVSTSLIIKENYNVIQKGSIVFAKVGAALLLNRFCLLPFDSCIDNNMMAFIPINDIDNRWSRYTFSSLLDFKGIVNSGPIPSVNQNQVGSVKIPLPPLPEQRAIADYLDEKCSKIDAAVENVGKQVDALKRLKRALINEVVTGKRKV